MAVIVFLASGDRREVDGDGAQMDGPFFIITRHDSGLRRTRIVLTLRSCDVISAEVQKDGITEFVLGAGMTEKR
jgi:hypothetical protein